MKKTLVSIILPSYNERENLSRLIPAIFAQFQGSHLWDREIIIVDDNSPDGTAAALTNQFGSRIRLIVRKHERGLATAIAEGIRAARGSVVLGMDADGNHDPRHIPALLSGLSASDMVIGSRYVSGGGMRIGIQYFLSFVSNSLLYHLLKFPVHDSTSGFYAVRNSVLQRVHLHKVYQGYGDYHLRLVWYAKKMGVSVTEVPVRYAFRHYGQSKSRLPIMLITYMRTVMQLCTGAT